MSLHAVSLMSYNRIQQFNQLSSQKLTKESNRLTLVESAYSSNPSKISWLSPTPQISVLSDAYSRPAVIGHVRSFGSYPEGTAAIREILVSVLNASGFKQPLLPEKMASQVAELQGSDTERCEDSSDCNHVDCDADNSHSVCPKPMDIRFMRHKACWENMHVKPPPSLDTTTHLPSTSQCPTASTLPALSNLQQLPPQSNHFTQVTLIGGAVASLLDSDPTTTSGKGHANAPSSLDQSLTFNGGLPVSTVNELSVSNGRCDSVKPMPLQHEDRNTFHRLSPSQPFDQQGAASTVNPGAIPLNRSLQDTFTLPVDVEKENAHFFVADMIIASLEKMKCNFGSSRVEPWSVEEAGGVLGSYPVDSEMASYTRIKKPSNSSSASSDSGYEGCTVMQANLLENLPSNRDAVKNQYESDYDDEEYVIIELEDFEDSSASPDESSLFEPGCNSAEATAQKLYRSFRQRWLQTGTDTLPSPCQITTREILVNKDDIPKEFESSVNLAEEIKVKSRLRGTMDWAPPRFQIIFNIHPSVKRNTAVAAQNFTCAGCGTPVEPKYIGRLRYCNYLGKYFCDCCHAYAESFIPGRILMKWDFTKYYICNFSKHLLDGIWQNPIFNVSCINKTLYTKAKELARVRDLQEQLLHIKKLLKTCRLAESALKEFEQMPAHLTEEMDLFSLDDLVKVKRGLLAPVLRDVLKNSTSHVENCELCQAKGFICEFCQNSDIIFPFQTAKCKRCAACKSCFHKQCFISKECPKCRRVAARRKVSDTPSPCVQERELL
uniref:Rubicon like autophagy enhancer n=1 Tax=Sphenodon punctatus TaxID=8508 RepID=A0A8D0H1R2_SPHPU